MPFQAQKKALPALSSTPADMQLLQRKWACSGMLGLSSECEEYREKQRGTIQRAAADRSVAGGQVPSIVQNVLRLPGQSLDVSTRTFMETRFGHDFSQVRVHSDNRAAQSARDMGALAYTVGQEVVFAAGQYAPHTPGGKRLIAHELAHTLQQEPGMPPIRRATSPFSVTGEYEDRGAAGEENFVYFDLARPSVGDNPPERALDQSEQDKVTNRGQAAVLINQSEITLYGFASEEGGAGVNTPLIERRLNAVQNLLVQAGFAPPGHTIHRQSRLACSENKYNYRFWRVVEMQAGTNASRRVCSPSSTEPQNCSADTLNRLRPVRARALSMINGNNGALARLDRYIQNQTLEPAVRSALDRYFGNSHSVATAQEARRQVDAIREVLEGLDGTGPIYFQCGTTDEPTCNTGSPANSSRERRRITICPSFFDNPEYSSRQVEILIHESSHASVYAHRDLAYGRERVILILPTDQALRNPQSITMFIMHLNGQILPMGPEHPDIVSSCDPSGRQEQLIREALAWAQRWNTYAKYGTAQVYGKPENRAYMAPYHNRHFGRSDKAAIAGIYDRYRAMDDWFDLFYRVQCTPAGDPACAGSRPVHWTLTRSASPSGGGPMPEPAVTTTTPVSNFGTSTTTPSAAPVGSAPAVPISSPASSAGTGAASSTPAGDIRVCPTFFGLGSLYDRVVEMYSGLALHMPGVGESLSRSYPRLAYDYKTEYWGVR